MKSRKYKGYSIFIFAMVICLLFINRIDNDRHITQFSQSDFRNEYIAQYTQDNADHLEFIPYDENAINTFVIGPLSYNKADYSVEVQYLSNDDSTILSIYSTDYTSLDNSGGKVFVYEDLPQNKSSLKHTFNLDQKVDSIFITIQTQDENFQIGRMNIYSEQIIYNDTFLYCFLTILLAAIWFFAINAKEDSLYHVYFMKKEISSKQLKISIAFIMLLVVFIASIPLVNEHIFAGHDITFHIGRIEGIARAIQSGQFPIRVHGGTVNDYGYPNSLFYPELLMYFPALLSLLGISLATCYKIYIVFINILTIIIAYISFKKLFDNRHIALTTSIIYLLNPYRLMVLYQRSAIGEFTAISFLPLVLYGMYAIIKGEKKDWKYLVLGATGVLQSHFITTELVVIVCMVVFLVSLKELFSKERRILYLVYSAVAVVLINLWFIGPMLLMMTQLGLAVFSRSQSPFGVSKYNIINLFSNSYFDPTGANPIGWISIIAVGFYLIYRLMVKKEEQNSKWIKVGDFLTTVVVISAIATTAYFPWDILSKIPLIGVMLDAVQFPYRVLTINGVAASALVGLTIFIWVSSRDNRIIVCILSILMVICSTFSYYEVSFVENSMSYFQNKHYYFNSLDNSLSVGQAEYLVEGANLDSIIADKPIIESDNETLTVSNFTRYGTELEFDYTIDISSDNNIIEIPFMYIPGYEILVNGQEVQPEKLSDAKVGFTSHSESGTVNVRYSSPTTFRIFEMISLISLVILIFNKNIFAIIKKQIKTTS